MAKYFVGIYINHENYYKCFRSEYYIEPSSDSSERGDVIWRGDSLEDGRAVAKKANEDRKGPGRKIT